MNEQLNCTEKAYFENEEYNKKNKEELVEKFDKAEDHLQEHGYSLTTAKLLRKYKCTTIEEYRAVRKANKKKNKKSMKQQSTPVSQRPTPTRKSRR